MGSVAGGDNPGGADPRLEDAALLLVSLAVADGSSPDDVGLPLNESARLKGPLTALHTIERVRQALARQQIHEPRLPPGQMLGPYEVGPLIAVGGMGEVYQARHSRLGRAVAIKIVGRRSSFDAAAVARFEREARLAASISHPNLATLYEVIDLDGRLCLVFELLLGETLQSRLSLGALPPGEAARVGERVARGLAALHAAGVTHRDIKPGNIFLCADGAVKVIDLGIARSVERSTDDSTTGYSILGTPSYMPPERIKRGVFTPAGDVFCLGVVLHEAMAGRHPFRRDTLDATLAAIVDGEPLGASFPGPFVQVFDRCLRKEPSERPSAFQVAEALVAIQSGHSPRLDPRGTTLKPSARVAVAGLVVLGAALLATTVGDPAAPSGSSTTPSPPSRPSPAAIEPGLYRDFLEAQALVDNASPASLKRAGELYRRVLESTPDFALGWARYANFLQMVSSFTDAVNPGPTQAEGLKAATRASTLDPNLGLAHQAMADLLAQANDWEGAEAAIRRALQLDPNAAETHHSYSVSILIPMGRLQEAERHSLRAVELQPYGSTYAEALGRVYYFQRRFEMAHRQWASVLERSPRELASMWRKGQVEILMGQPVAALESFALADSFTPGIQKGQALIAVARAQSGDVKGARAIRDRLIALRRNGRYVSPTLLGVIDVGLGDTDSAFQNLMEACQARADWVRYAKVDPLLDPIRTDPRFNELLRCLRLTP